MTDSFQPTALAGPAAGPSGRLRAAVRAGARGVRHLVSAGVAHGRAIAGRPTRFAGAWPSREAALASLPVTSRAGYDAEGVAEVNFAEMCDPDEWDYPVIHWLGTLLRPGLRVLDAGGHMATKYIAFARYLPVQQAAWTVSDLPAIVAAGRRAQADGRVPAAVRFADDPATAGTVDLLLASGLLQYLDAPFPAYLGRLAQPPRHILLNKVALRDGPEVVTLERIGPARVPYRIRDRAVFERDLATLGYRVRDTWRIRALGHVIPTHPWLGESESRGYLLERC